MQTMLCFHFRLLLAALPDKLYFFWSFSNCTQIVALGFLAAVYPLNYYGRSKGVLAYIFWLSYCVFVHLMYYHYFLIMKYGIYITYMHQCVSLHSEIQSFPCSWYSLYLYHFRLFRFHLDFLCVQMHLLLQWFISQHGYMHAGQIQAHAQNPTGKFSAALIKTCRHLVNFLCQSV